MGLTPLYDDHDEFFNAPAAQAAFEMVMKMDDEEARAFTTLVAVDLLWDDIAKNQRSLQRHLDRVVTKQYQAAAAVYERAGNEELAKAFTEISKAPHTPYYYGYQFDENKINRDRGSGQFRAKIHYITDKPIPKRHARKLGLETTAASRMQDGPQKAYYQQAYHQVSTFLDQFADQGLGGDTDFIYTVEGENGHVGSFRTSGAKFPSGNQFDPNTERILEVEARPTGLNLGGASFGLVGALGGDVEAQHQAGYYGNRVGRAATPFYDQWTTKPEDATSSNSRLYNRVGTGSAFVASVAPFGSKLQLAGVFGTLVGNHGPQAEKVIGPKIRTTMYRYRGTEKDPDPELVGPYDRALTGYKADSITPEAQAQLKTRQNRALAAAQKTKGSELSRAERAQVIAASNREGLGLSGAGESAEQAKRGKERAWEVADAFLQRKVPNKDLYDLQMKGGHTPPSEGLIIDSSGKIVTQAIGYGDDHYLPFNLKNLSGLKGGEYIRTRSVGGPTTEDIYTGLVTGAKRITVISRSGTFTVDFDDTFRGSRRYNDKAGRMVGRYEKLLDAVKSREVSRAEVEPSVQRRIANEVEEEYGDWTPPREKRRAYKKRIEEYKAYPTISEEDDARIDAALAQHGFESDKERETARADLRNQLIESKAFNYELNGTGYEAALKALQEQFPYYIADTHLKPLHTPTHYASEKDRGYVKPRYNRPEEALEGYYDTSIAGQPRAGVTDVNGDPTGKFTADTADFQNWQYNAQNPKSREARGTLKPVRGEGEDEAEGAAPTPGSNEPSAPELAADKIERQKIQVSLADKAWAVLAKVRGKYTGDDETKKRSHMGDFLFMNEDDFKNQYKTNASIVAKFESAIDKEVVPNQGTFQAQSEVAAYLGAKNLAGGVPYNKEQHIGSEPSNPYTFKQRPYLLRAKEAVVNREKSRLAHNFKIPGQPPLDQLQTDEQFKDALKTVQQIRQISGEMTGMDLEDRKQYVAGLQSIPGALDQLSDEGKKMILHPEKVDELVEAVHRAWQLRRNEAAVSHVTPPAAAAPEAATAPEAAAPEAPAPAAAPAAGPVSTVVPENPGDIRAGELDYSGGNGMLMVETADHVIATLYKTKHQELGDELGQLRENLDAALTADSREDAQIAGRAMYAFLKSNQDPAGKMFMARLAREQERKQREARGE